MVNTFITYAAPNKKKVISALIILQPFNIDWRCKIGKGGEISEVDSSLQITLCDYP